MCIRDSPNTIDASSLLELESNSKVLVATRISTTEMNAITPLIGALVFNIDQNCFYQYTSSGWQSLCQGSTTLIDNGDGTITYTDEGGVATTISLNDPDADPTNELQQLLLNGTDLTLSNGGGTITIPTAIGPQGPAGTDGVDGAVGPQGPAGTDGVDGAVGPQGPAGTDGVDGAVGPQGPAGTDGVDGAVGPQGPAGADGVDGAIGPQGPAGADGADGAVGPQGPAGADGVDGAVGPQGPAGTNGADGAVGPAGADGVDGATGPVGPSGTYLGHFIITGTGNITITGIPFQPSQISFVAHANVETLNLNSDNGVGDNNTGLSNSFGTMNGYVRDTTQQVIYVGGSGNSINDISRFASSSHCIAVRYGNQNGNNLGITSATFSAFTADGFTINVDSRADNLVVLFQAYE